MDGGNLLVEFFFGLRARGVPASLHEFTTLLGAMRRGLHFSDMETFYRLARSLLVKDVAQYDAYDQVFAHLFRGVDLPPGIPEEIAAWLENPLPRRELPAELIARLRRLGLDGLLEEFEKRLREQRERHDGGDRWIGTGGTSPFGHGGYHPEGIRVGGAGGGRSAIKVAAERRFRNYRADRTLDVRQIQVALRKLRVLHRHGARDELDLDATIDRTCREGGEIDLVWRAPRRNRLRVLLLLDSGGSMDPFADLVDRLFSAACSMRHFKALDHYYFHNCVYENLYADMWRSRAIPTAKVLAEHDADWRVILVGDASMAPSELLAKWGAIDYRHANDTPGIVWLDRVARHFRKAVWLNPTDESEWRYGTGAAIRRIFPMFRLTVEGIEQAAGAMR